MSMIAPTITAYDLHEYREQMNRITPFATRIHIDLMDGVFAPTKSPDIEKLWLPDGVPCDIHVMFQHPGAVAKKLALLKPTTLIVQVEASKQSVLDARSALLGSTVRFGISLLSETDPLDPKYAELVRTSRYILIFSGHLGLHGGVADLRLLDKVAKIKSINPQVEIGWDGGINIQNARTLVDGGVDVLNVGAAVQKTDDPKQAYKNLMQAIA